MNGIHAVFRKRLLQTAVLGGLIWMTALGFHWYRAVPWRAEAEAQARKISMRRGEISLPRGRILHSSGEILAHSGMQQDLIRLHPAAAVPVELRQYFGDRMTEGIVAVSGLDARDVVALEKPLRNRSGDWEIRTREKRYTAPEWQKITGETELRNGTLYGISGLELRYDRTLRGKPGEYEVMLDRRGNWIPGTWRWLKKPVPGADVTVSAEELL